MRLSSNNRTNKKLAEELKKLSDYYKYLGKPDRFRALAYEQASDTIRNLPTPIEKWKDQPEKIDALRGIGSSITEKIREYLESGKIQLMEKMKKKVPEKLMPLLKIDGIGPATIHKIREQLNIENPEALTEMLKHDFENISKVIHHDKAIKLLKQMTGLPSAERLPLKEAEKIAERIKLFLITLDGVKEVIVAGSIRRKKETIGDIDIIVITELKDTASIIEKIRHYDGIEKLLLRGKKKISFLLKQQLFQTDIRFFSPNEKGSAMLYFTGPKEHNIALRRKAAELGYKVNEYGIFDKKNNRRVAGENETGIYILLGLDYILPELRSGEIVTIGDSKLSAVSFA